MFERPFTRRLVPTVICGLLLTAGMPFSGPAKGQDAPKKGAGVNVSFLPPPLEGATYSVGIYEAKSGKLVRRLCEAAPQSTFTVGLNGLVTSWDGKDDNGKTVPSGRYAARGYAVGPMNVEGVAILGNDWAADDERLRIMEVQAIVLVPEDEGLIAVVQIGDEYELLRYSGTDGRLLWHKPVGVGLAVPQTRTQFPLCTLAINGEILTVTALHQATWQCRIADGEGIGKPTFQSTHVDETFAKVSAGKDGTTWKIEDGFLVQYSPSGEIMRRLTRAKDDPEPIGVTASPKSDRLYLLERSGDLYQRVRGLSWMETNEEDGKQVSTWKTFFEKTINLFEPSLGLNWIALATTPAPAVEITLAENPLSPGKPERAKLTATFDEKGGYLATSDGLRLRQVSQRAHLRAVKLVKDKAVSALTFYQTDGAAWDEFSIKGAKEIAGFDAGEFEITGAGVEKTNDAKAPEPDL